MKRILIATALAVQILTACGQGTSSQKTNNSTVNTASAVEHDTAWYSSRVSEVVSQINDLMKEIQTVANATPSAERDAQIASINSRGDSLETEYKGLILEIAKKYKKTTYPAKFLGGETAYYFDYDELKEICDPKSGYYNEPQMTLAKRLFAAIEKRHPGKQYSDLVMPDMTGKTVKLSDYVGKGKYVLIDFWASWCGPCRQEMPNVVEAYNKYKGKNFEIVGISFDENKASWTAAVKSLGMTWPQMSDLKGWHSVGASTYGINSIPANVLVDPKGKIIAIDLRGEALQNKLAEVLK